MEPLLYALYLVLGAICTVISVVMVIHMFLYLILNLNGKPIHAFLNNMLEDVENSKASVFSTVLFAFIGYYLMLCAVKGNIRVGMRFFCVTFYPLL